MTPLFMTWLALSVFAGGMLLWMVYWDRRHPEPHSSPKAVTLWDLMCGAALALCPVINVFVSIGMVVWFCSTVAPNIVVLRGQK